ncbi:MAG: RagB/SusD family nutrient uptake outer membrane protein, partial [Flavisolibacter sp.]|nr:RagB/SusD family nutrient uptake outer membrane protein [Flavisolibacter sp.]
MNLKLTESQGPELTAKRNSVEDFYKVIVEDLEFAKENLPNSWDAEYSRATKKSALGLLARAYLTRAHYATGAEATSYFTKARDAAKEVIDRATEFQISLWPNYADLWLPANNKKMSAAGGESLYTISNSATNTAINYDNNANRMHLWYLMQYSGKIGGLVQSLEYGNDNQRRLMPTLALLDFYNEEIDSRYEGSFQEVWLANTAYTWTAADATKYQKASSIVGKSMKPGVDTALYITKKRITDKATRPYLVFDRYTTYF